MHTYLKIHRGKVSILSLSLLLRRHELNYICKYAIHTWVVGMLFKLGIFISNNSMSRGSRYPSAMLRFIFNLRPPLSYFCQCWGHHRGRGRRHLDMPPPCLKLVQLRTLPHGALSSEHYNLYYILILVNHFSSHFGRNIRQDINE